MMDLKQHIRHVPDFPKAGILFYDITTLLRNAEGFAMTIDMLSSPYVGKGVEVVVGIESRGFTLGAPVEERIKAGFIPIRKPGKLPSKTLKESYALEYGMDSLEVHEDAIENGHQVLIVDSGLASVREVHEDAIENGHKVLIVDDVLATGGTASAAAKMVRKLGGDLQGLAFLI